MKLALIGGGGFAKEVAEIAMLNKFEVSGYFADEASSLLWPYLGKPSSAEDFKQEFVFAFGIGAINAAGLLRRRELINQLLDVGIMFPSLVSPHAVVSEGVSMGMGVVVGHGAILSVNATIGDFCLINTSAVVGHDVVVGKNTILAPLSFLAGSAEIGENVLIGPNSSVLEGRSVSDNCIVGCGSVVHRNIRTEATVLPVVTKIV